MDNVPVYVLQGIGYGFAAAVQPGPFQAYIIAQTLNNGWRSFGTVSVTASPSRQQSLLRAAMMNVLSPGPYIYWSLVTGPVLLAGWREAPTNGIGFLVGFYAAMILTLSGIIVLFGTARHLGPKVNRAMLGTSVVALACFGFYQLWLGMVSI